MFLKLNVLAIIELEEIKGFLSVLKKVQTKI